jgi:hypothetical protein
MDWGAAQFRDLFPAPEWAAPSFISEDRNEALDLPGARFHSGDRAKRADQGRELRMSDWAISTRALFRSGYCVLTEGSSAMLWAPDGRFAFPIVARRPDNEPLHINDIALIPNAGFVLAISAGPEAGSCWLMRMVYNGSSFRRILRLLTSPFLKTTRSGSAAVLAANRRIT